MRAGAVLPRRSLSRNDFASISRARSQITYSQLLALVKSAAKALAAAGVGKGSRVLAHLPLVPQLPVLLLACARLGAVHSVSFAGFGADALAQRIADEPPCVLVTADAFVRGAKTEYLKPVADAAIAKAAQRGIKVPKVLRFVFQFLCVMRLTPFEVLVVAGAGPKGGELGHVAWTDGRDEWWHDAIELAENRRDPPVEFVDAEHPLFSACL